MNGIETMMKIQKLRKFELAGMLQLSQPTLKRYLREPMQFKLEHIEIMSKIFYIDIELLISSIMKKVK